MRKLTALVLTLMLAGCSTTTAIAPADHQIAAKDGSVVAEVIAKHARTVRKGTEIKAASKAIGLTKNLTDKVVDGKEGD